MTKTAIVLLIEDAEEMEVVTPVDILRRAGVKVTIAGIAGSSPVRCSRDIYIVPDESLESAVTKGPYDAVILPGGRIGSKNLADSEAVGALVRQQEAEGRILATICAAATALKKHGVGKGKRVTTFPTSQAAMEKDGDYIYSQDRVVVDGNLITSRGPGTALEFALAITEALVGKEQMDALADNILFKK
ncbi:Parkinson disease protein 7 homolog [Neocloeon triangulifer]|uniref:Parkinson disease protein 7 homolog n=1 Tax=Neocloeon triangulifer TaxID=2078957 RepID=UPI00286F8EE6|nr:Parkinson disease protein 7 homolog [Neocloeon triangulifer]